MKFSYDRLVVSFFTVFLLYLTGSVINILVNIPSINELESKEVKVEEVKCSMDGNNSVTQLKVDIGDGPTFKIIKGLNDCSERRLGYLVGETISVLVTDKVKLSLWQVQYKNRMLIEYDDARSVHVSGFKSVLFFGWGLFFVIFFIRKIKAVKGPIEKS